MNKWKGRVALVTGASSGIGAHIAEDLVKAGMKVVGCARRQDKIHELGATLEATNAEGKLYPVECDLEDQTSIDAMFKGIEESLELGRIDLLINNAGISVAESLATISMTDMQRMLSVNLLGPSQCTQRSVDLMQRTGVTDGLVIFINSVSGMKVVNFAPTRFYSVTKHALRALSEGWRQELKDMQSNIRVASILPGFVETEFMEKSFAGKEDDMPDFSVAKGLETGDISSVVQYILCAPPHVDITDIVLRPSFQTD